MEVFLPFSQLLYPLSGSGGGAGTALTEPPAHRRAKQRFVYLNKNRLQADAGVVAERRENRCVEVGVAEDSSEVV